MESPALQGVVRHGTDDTVVIALTGELDSSSARLLTLLVRTALESSVTRLIVDCERVTFCDGAGVRVLLAARAEAQAACIPFTIRSVNRRLLDLFLLTGVDRLLPPDPDAHPTAAAGQ